MKERINKLISNLKHLPGVYLMYDKNDTIIYVGKAKDLFKRVSQYFLREQYGKVAKMVSEAEYFDTIIVNNEKESLVLEMNLIQKHYPKFNILLKDGSHYPYIAIKKKGDPYLSIKRNDKDKAFDYFGPFPNSSSAYNMISLMNKIFQVRKCNHIPSTPCLYYHLGQCLAPCINDIDEEVYACLREKMKAFLKGDNKDIVNELKEKMIAASNNLEYENAYEYKKLIDSINHINTSQNVEVSDHVDRDIYAYSSKNGYLSIAIQLYRNGRLLDKKSYIVEEFDDNEQQVGELITQFYSTHPLPKEIIINSDSVVEYLNNFLDVHAYSVSKGKFYDMVLAAKQNAANALDEYFLTARLDDDKIQMLEEIGTTLNIPTPYHIELFDNSHIQGSYPVGAMVAFVNGDKAKKLYRKFKINHEESRDDLASMKEIISRHYLRNKTENKKMPDLILVDGGLIQIEAALSALKEIDVSIPVFGLYKNDKHQTEGVIDKDGNTYTFTNKSIFFLLTRMQDEVHRFAISFHQTLRGKAMTTSIFDDIKGLGKKRQEMLVKAYPDISLLKEASLNELEQLLPPDVALLLFEKLHS